MRCNRHGPRLVAFLLPVTLLGCSKDPAEAPSEDVDIAEVAPIFAQGFKDASRIEPSRTAYDLDPGIRRRMNEQLAGNLRRNFSLEFAIPDPEHFIRSGAAVDVADRKLEALGLPINDLASATVLMFGLAWELANGEKLNTARQQALVRQVDKQLTDRDSADLQREADARLIMAGLWLEESRLRRESPDQTRQLSDAVQRDMKRMSGNDMRAHDIKDGGFAER